MVYVALLRGVNVGGHNKVNMKKLKISFELLGFKNVITYINSGNIIFKETSRKQEHIVNAIEKAIQKDFQLDVKVLVRDLQNISFICDKLPVTWVKNETMRTDVMFLWEQFDNPKIIEQLQINTVDNVKYEKGVVLWNVESKNYSKSAILKIVGTELYQNITIRNVNTIRKIHQIMTSI